MRAPREDVGCSGSDGGGAGLGRHHGLLYAPTTSHSNGFPPPNLAQAPLYPSGQSTPSAPQASRGLTACPSGSRGVRSRVPVEPADARSRPERGQGQAPRPAQEDAQAALFGRPRLPAQRSAQAGDQGVAEERKRREEREPATGAPSRPPSPSPSPPSRHTPSPPLASHRPLDHHACAQFGVPDNLVQDGEGSRLPTTRGY